MIRRKTLVLTLALIPAAILLLPGGAWLQAYRSIAVYCLGELDDPEVLTVLRNLAEHDPEQQVRSVARDAIKRVGTRSVSRDAENTR